MRKHEQGKILKYVTYYNIILQTFICKKIQVMNDIKCNLIFTICNDWKSLSSIRVLENWFVHHNTQVKAIN